MDERRKQGRPASRPVEKRKAFYVNVTVRNSQTGIVSHVLISRDSKAEIKLLLARSKQVMEFLGYWNGKEYEKVNLNN
jgi:hypothetical protein